MFHIAVEAKYEHFGEVIDRVDERGEVALLSRNIVIEGEMESNCVSSNGNCNKWSIDTYGGHLKVTIIVAAAIIYLDVNTFVIGSVSNTCQGEANPLWEDLFIYLFLLRRYYLTESEADIRPSTSHLHVS